MPAGARLLVLPQRPYLPEGSLRDAITFPRVLPGVRTHVSQLCWSDGRASWPADRLDEEAHWQQRLSLGEQQRLTVVRSILFEPDWLLLDEATASLDEPAERQVYTLMRERLPRATIVSVGHRSTLRALHSRCIEVDRRHARCEPLQRSIGQTGQPATGSAGGGRASAARNCGLRWLTSDFCSSLDRLYPQVHTFAGLLAPRR